MTTSSRPIARPKAQPPAPRKKTSKEFAQALRETVTVRVLREQDDYSAEAAELAAQLGWEGAPTDVLFGIQVADARRFLAKTLHEVHVAVLNPNSDRARMPTAERVCQHLGLSEDYLDEVREALAKAVEREAPRPTTPLG